MIIAKQLILAFGIATLAACGGGGGGTSTQNNASNSSGTPSSSSSSQHETTSTAPAAGESDTPSDTGTTTTDSTTSTSTPSGSNTTGTDTTTSTTSPSTGTDPVVDDGATDTTTDTTTNTDTVTDTTPVPSAPDIALSWTIPAAREDGSYMPVYEIAGYELRYTKDQSAQVTVVRINDAQTTDWVFEDVAPGNYQFTIATIDSDGLYSANSQTVSTRIQ